LDKTDGRQGEREGHWERKGKKKGAVPALWSKKSRHPRVDKKSEKGRGPLWEDADVIQIKRKAVAPATRKGGEMCDFDARRKGTTRLCWKETVRTERSNESPSLKGSLQNVFDDTREIRCAISTAISGLIKSNCTPVTGENVEKKLEGL